MPYFLAAAAVATAVSATGAVMQGNATAQQNANAQGLADQQAKDTSLQALEASGQRREQLRSSLSNIAANQTQMNVNIDSPSSVAINSAVKTKGNADDAMAQLGYLNKGHALSWQAAADKQAGSNAITAGWMTAGGDVASGVLKMGGM